MPIPYATTAATKLTVVYRPIDSLCDDPDNPNTHSPAQLDAVTHSMATFGCVVPILVDASGQVISGHLILAAARKLGLSQVPTITLEHLTPSQCKALMIALNRLAQHSKWDERKLGKVLHDLSVADLDFALDVVGFSVGEIDFYIEAFANDASENDPADGPVDLARTAVSVIGDLWRLGRHRLLCGTSLGSLEWKHLMAGELASIGFTDPPYNVKVHGHVSGLGKVRHREFAMASGEMDRDEFEAFLSSAFTLMAEHSSPGSIHFAAIDWKHTPEMIAAGEAAFTELKNICVWQKPSGGMGSLYRSQHELFFVWKSGRGRHRNNIELGKNGRSRTNIWSYPSAAGFRHSEGGDLLADHPTCKPVALVADAILDVSKRGEIVIDPFMGSGTTIIAAERGGRIAYGIEIDPPYVDAAIRRFEKLTGQEVLHEDGRNFSQVAAERAVDVGEAA